MTARPLTAGSSRGLLAVSTIVTLMLAGCSTLGSGAAGSAPLASSASPSASANRSTKAVTPSPSPTPAHLSPPSVAGLTWTAAGSLVHGVPATYVARTANGAVGLLWIDPSLVTFRLIPGTKVPEGSPTTPADNQPSTWVPRMVAAFNGGFLLKDNVGGYYADHTLVRTLRPGLAALAITSDGRLAVGAWGRDLGMTPQTVTVRQNLPLLVDHGQARTSPGDSVRTWGVANGGLATANRSALGQLADGSLVYAYGHETTPAIMAAALVLAGVDRAMMLDMNKSWPGGFVYHRKGSHWLAQRVHPLEYHSGTVYDARYTKDFVAVLTR